MTDQNVQSDYSMEAAVGDLKASGDHSLINGLQVAAVTDRREISHTL